MIYIGIIFLGWIITFALCFYAEWIMFPDDNRTPKQVFKYMHYIEYTPILNTIALCAVLAFIIIGFSSVAIIRLQNWICEKIIK